ncbi:MAG: DUF6495 family protein [Bacteroidota bacterium]
MKHYRRLTTEELQPLEKDFVDFLVVNGITADDWVSLKEKDIEKADRMVDLFSEVVFEGIFRKAQFLEVRTKRFVHAYQCLVDKIVLVGAETTEAHADLSEGIGPNVPISIFMTEKAYNGKREYELFEMTQKGCTLSDGQLFKSLSLAYMESKHGK